MATKYKENPLYESLIGVSQAVGKATMPRKTTPSPKSVNTSQYQNIPQAISGLGRISTPYGGSTNFESFHPGVDIANKQGTPIPAFTGGTVTETKTGQSWTPNKPSFGNYTIIQDKQGNYHRYSHLNRGFVKVGDVINQGDIIGEMGHSGGSYSPSGGDPSHLDYRIRDAYNKYISPISYLSNY